MDSSYTDRQRVSIRETKNHIALVGHILNVIAYNMQSRAIVHDSSKLEEPELSVFTEVTHKLRGLTYGSEEYKSMLAEMKPALDHHYANNSHHPEHYEDGVNGMNLIDLIEMIADWKAATMRHNDGDIKKSIHLNKERFGLSNQLVSILLNTVPLLDASIAKNHQSAEDFAKQELAEIDNSDGSM